MTNQSKYGILVVYYNVWKGAIKLQTSVKDAIKTPVDELVSGMVIARNVYEPDSEKILLYSGSKLDSVTIFNLKERYNVRSVWIKNEISKAGIAKQMKAEIDVHESLNTLKDVFGSDEDTPLESITEEAVSQVDNLADDLLQSVEMDDNLLLKMHQLQSYDDSTYKHCLRVAMMSVSIGKQLNLPKEKLRDLAQAALLHDIGKRMIPIEIIRKPGKLTDAEFAEIKKHPSLGYRLLKEHGGYSQDVMNAVLMHQEKYDGTGYPLHFKGEKISYLARIITVADVYDALTSIRPYRQPWSVAEAEEFMMGGSYTHFDYEIILAFLAAFAPYPVGGMVLLSDGRKAIVKSNNANVLRPVVQVQNSNGGVVEEIDLYNDFKYLSLSIVKNLKE